MFFLIWDFKQVFFSGLCFCAQGFDCVLFTKDNFLLLGRDEWTWIEKGLESTKQSWMFCICVKSWMLVAAHFFYLFFTWLSHLVLPFVSGKIKEYESPFLTSHTFPFPFPLCKFFYLLSQNRKWIPLIQTLKIVRTNQKNDLLDSYSPQFSNFLQKHFSSKVLSFILSIVLINTLGKFRLCQYWLLMEMKTVAHIMTYLKPYWLTKQRLFTLKRDKNAKKKTLEIQFSSKASNLNNSNMTQNFGNYF